MEKHKVNVFYLNLPKNTDAIENIISAMTTHMPGILMNRTQIKDVARVMRETNHGDADLYLRLVGAPAVALNIAKGVAKTITGIVNAANKVTNAVGVNAFKITINGQPDVQKKGNPNGHNNGYNSIKGQPIAMNAGQSTKTSPFGRPITQNTANENNGPVWSNGILYRKKYLFPPKYKNS